ncbi:MAG: hypothetical protein NVS4B12_02460 [Ktedonobacteraceae bacterium]
MMPRQMKVNACLTFVLAALFYLFFQIAKHHPVLSPVNAFADDPYDSVGTAGVQLAMFTAILSLVRTFRPYQLKKDVGNQKVLLMRGEYITCLSVAVTSVADIVAVIRYPSVWIGFPAGQMLIVLIGGLALLTALVGWLLFRSAQALMLPSVQGGWRRAITLSCMGILILALYPASWLHNVLGELLTVFVGMALFFASVWAWGMILSPSLETHGEDFIDDLVSMYRWLKAHMDHFSVFFTAFEKTFSSPFLRTLVNWLNPRKHSWNGILLFGMCMGIVLALAEAMGEGGLGPRFAVLATVFVVLESTGILMGYAFLAKPLGLFRHDSEKM